jgi:3-hydroxyisobutyrate dehydrogenase-like beta-hydroxyacid dehydrogenase
VKIVTDSITDRRPDPVVAVLGLGEAGSILAGDLGDRGVDVVAWDPAVSGTPGSVRRAPDARSAVHGSSVILSINTAGSALGVAGSVSSILRPGQLFADLNTMAPHAKRKVAAVVEGSEALFADVALMGPVPRRRLGTPVMVSGSGAGSFAAIFEPLGVPVTLLGPEAGAASERKLVRSVFMKGMAAAVAEAAAAAERLGFLADAIADMECTLADADGALVARLLDGSVDHSVRRAAEVRAAICMLESVGVTPRISMATREWLIEIDARQSRSYVGGGSKT